MCVLACGELPSVTPEKILPGYRRCGLPNITNTSQTYCIIQGCVARGFVPVNILLVTVLCLGFVQTHHFEAFPCKAGEPHKTAAHWIC